MQLFGRAAVSDFVGDWIVYRNLIPADPNLPNLDEVRQRIDLHGRAFPRKSDPDYAKVIVYFLNQARSLEITGKKIKRLILLGDTRLLDGTAFTNICKAGEWQGIAFIGSEDNSAPEVKIEASGVETSLYLANRWDFLTEFDRYCTGHNLGIDETTAVVVDLDKTALGARGRNAQVIDRVRKLAVEMTVGQLLETEFVKDEFRTAYDELNRVDYHVFTADNQDYLAYICLILSSGFIGLDDLKKRVHNGQITSFRNFIEEINSKKSSLPPGLKDIHTDIYMRVEAGDPTPFKQFRCNEYLLTVNHMGQLADDSPSDLLVEQEILITHEVRTIVELWRARGALLFCLSDKPDEASFPSPELAKEGFLPVHRTITHSVGFS